ncbi:hypothetical protein DMC01_05660 [Campylobacter troglodytis]|nr:hypothetical protein DMC01_05660 [Campylobacter troglodytis]
MFSLNFRLCDFGCLLCEFWLEFECFFVNFSSFCGLFEFGWFVFRRKITSTRLGRPLPLLV